MKIKHTIFDLIIAVMVIFLAFRVFNFILEMKSAYENYAPDISYMSDLYYQEDYEKIAAYTLEYSQSNQKKEYEEYWALGNYYNEALLHVAYLSEGDYEKADISQKKMEKYLSQMGSLSDASEKILDNIQ